jgi:predicted DNA repair protein MutK
MAGILGYLSILTDDISALAGKTMASATKSLVSSLDDVGILFDDIITYTKLAGAKSSGLLVDDLAAISSFTSETTSDILKKELKKANSIDELKQNIKDLDNKSQEEILSELEVLKTNIMKKAQKNAAKRELPIVYKIAKGSFKNKFIIIPIVLIASVIAPWLIAPALILGGVYLSYEGVEAILKKLFHHEEHNLEDKNKSPLSNEEFEKQKVQSAIKTDFILSFGIIVITLSLVSQTEFITKLSVLIIVGVLTTVVVYGVVALIIKLDDIGFYFQDKKSKPAQVLGNALVSAMPKVIKSISIIGTVAMLAVGGGIIAHETHLLSFLDDSIALFGDYSYLASFASEILFGIVIGYIAVKTEPIVSKIIKKIGIFQ